MSSYRGPFADLSGSDKAGLESFRPSGCRLCGGLGYIPKRGEAMAADPCGCDQVEEEE